MKDLSKNPFLTVGVSADAEMHGIRQVAQRLLMEHRLEGGPNAPAARRIEKALEQLQDPVERFHWGLYWPELTKEEAERFRADPVLSTLADNPLQDAAAAYQRIAADVSPDIRSHNLGVLSLLQAIAATEAAQKDTPEDISDDLACAALWKRAFEHLLPIVTGDAFWMRKKIWARDLGDKRLNEARLANIRATYIAELLAPIGAVISTALLDGHAPVAKTYVDLIRGSGFEASVVEETLSKVYKPLADRVERAVARLKERLEKLEEDEEETLPESALQELLVEFERTALQGIDVMIAVGDLPGYAEEHARDTSAEFLRSLSVEAWNRGRYGNLSEKLMFIASRIADSASIRSKIREDRATIERLVKEKEASDKLAPRYEHLRLLLDGMRWKDALPLIRDLQSCTSGDAKDHMVKLYNVISNNVASDSFKKAMEAIKQKDFAQAHMLLSEAATHASDLQLKALVHMAQQRTPTGAKASANAGANNSGCFVYLAFVPIAAAVKGVLDAIHAYII